MERPLCVVNGDLARNSHASIYANMEGLSELRDAIDKLLAGKANQLTLPVARHLNWNNLVIRLATQEDFRTSEGACTCGCQKEFAAEEAKYAQPWSEYVI